MAFATSFSPCVQPATLRLFMPDRLPIYEIEHDIVAALKATKRLTPSSAASASVRTVGTMAPKPRQ